VDQSDKQPQAQHNHNHNGISKRIHKIDSLFRSNNNVMDTGQAALNNIPVIQPLNFDNATTTNNATATVKIPVCNGLVGGPCLDKVTGQIIP
jgi:hypothetical protein